MEEVDPVLRRVEILRVGARGAILHAVASHIEIGVEDRADGDLYELLLLRVHVKQHAADADLVTVEQTVRVRRRQKRHLRVDVIHGLLSVVGGDFDLCVILPRNRHLDSPGNLTQPLQASVAALQVAEHNVRRRLDLERLDEQRGIFLQHHGLREDRRRIHHDADGESVLYLVHVVVDLLLLHVISLLGTYHEELELVGQIVAHLVKQGEALAEADQAVDQESRLLQAREHDHLLLVLLECLDEQLRGSRLLRVLVENIDDDARHTRGDRDFVDQKRNRPRLEAHVHQRLAEHGLQSRQTGQLDGYASLLQEGGKELARFGRGVVPNVHLGDEHANHKLAAVGARLTRGNGCEDVQQNSLVVERVRALGEEEVDEDDEIEVDLAITSAS